jgi:GT2 family glycosyltransferase
MQLSVIILNYNVRYFLEQCVLSVQKALEGIESEIIVIDNNSSDDSCLMMKERFPHIKLIENKENLGFPKGNNIAVAQAKGEYICILNPDTVVAEDTFKKLLNTDFCSLNTGIIGCKLIDGTGNFLPESKRGIPTPWVAFTKIFGLYKISNIFGKYYASHLSENESGEVEILVGAFMMMKRSLFNELEGFDENCFMYSDDIDLSYRSLLKGNSNYYFPETTVVHYKGESTVKDEVYVKHFREFMNFFYQKHFKPSLFFSIFMKIGVVYFSFVKLFQGKPKAKSIPENYIFISNNQETLQKLELKLQKKVQLADSINESVPKFSEIILDSNYMTFKEAISFIEKCKNKSFTFKILPPNCNFIIGSNSSNDRGEVIVFEQ